MADEAAQLSFLRERQQLAIQETQEKVKQLDDFKKDYEALKERLVTLPDKLSHDVMVPIGKKAFMPGKIVHTNEILVLLGDNWFAEQSAKQSAAIVDRRIAVLDKQITDLKQQEGLLQPRLDFTSELEGMAQEKSEMYEIKEEYDPEKEKKWRAEHQRRVKEHKANVRKQRDRHKTEESSHAEGTPSQGTSDEELWARLDQLERQEAQGREMERRLSEDEGSEIKSSNKQSGPKTIRWEDEKEEDEEEEEESSEEEDYLSDDDLHELRQKSILHFKHSKANTEVNEASSAPMGDAPSITSPSDIYKYFLTSGPASILKKPSTQLRGGLVEPVVQSQVPAIRQESTKAFQEAVVERNVVEPTASQSDSQTEQPQKRVSKFKAQRMQQKR